MFDLSLGEITRTGYIFCSMFFFFILAIYWKRAVMKVAINKTKGDILLLFLIIIFSVTAMCFGDFWGYMADVEMYYPGIPRFHLEKVYEYIIICINKNYFLFRTIVWGGAAIFYYMAAKKYRVNTLLSLFIMFAMYTMIFCYARATLAMAIYFLGFAMFCKGKEHHKKSDVILGVIVMLVSYIFHTSASILIMLTAAYYIRITKENYKPMLILIILVGLSIDVLFDSFLNSMQGSDNRIGEKSEYILEFGSDEQEKINATLFGYLALIWEYVPFYLTFYVVSKIFLYGKRAIPSNTMVALFRVTFFIVVLATSFLMFSSKSLTFFYRILYMSFMPLSILTVYLFTNSYMPYKKYKLILYAGGGWNIYMFFSFLMRAF